MKWIAFLVASGAISCAPKKPHIEAHQLGFETIKIPAGVFWMGSLSSERDRGDLESRHKVRIMDDMIMMRTEVTHGLWAAVMPNDSRVSCGERCPITEVSWSSAIEFANALSLKDGLAPCYVFEPRLSWDFGCTGWRLPTEAEWERAAKGNGDLIYAGSNQADSVAWHSNNSGKQPHIVCSKLENPFGLCDMSGNVAEWVWDYFGAYSNPSDERMAGAVVDPIGRDGGRLRIVRGGSIASKPSAVRVSARHAMNPDTTGVDIGFRLLRRIEE